MFHHSPEKVQGEHIEEKMPPAAVDHAIRKHPIPFLSVPHGIGIEQQFVAIQRAGEAKNAHQRGNYYEDESYHFFYPSLVTMASVAKFTPSFSLISNLSFAIMRSISVQIYAFIIARIEWQ